MAKTGRPRTATVLKILTGRAPPSRRRDESKVAVHGVPAIPPGETLTPDEQIAFDWLRTEGCLAAVHGTIDGGLLVQIARCMVALRAAQAKVREFGPVMKAPSGALRVQPYQLLALQLGNQYRALLVEASLTPAARLRCAEPFNPRAGRDPNGGDTWDDFE
jgi:hypothetical protein